MPPSLRFVCIFTFCVSAAANAANLDCARVVSLQDQMICSDSTLLASHTKLVGLYDAALTRLSPKGSATLRENQRAWLEFLSATCTVPVGQAVRDAAVSCLSSRYADRIADLQQIAIQKGPFLFTRVDRYRVTDIPRTVVNDDNKMAVHHIAYPQIDQPITAITDRWNQISAHLDDGSSCDAGDGDTAQGYNVTFVSARVISVAWWTTEYCHGTPHGFGSGSTQTLVLSPTPHPLQPADLFRIDRPWRERLTELVRAGVHTEAQAEQIELKADQDSTIAELAVDPGDWILSEAGLTVAFGPYVLNAGRNFHPSVTFSWSDLRDVMVSDTPIP